jgi:hypothetical protein
MISSTIMVLGESLMRPQLESASASVRRTGSQSKFGTINETGGGRIVVADSGEDSMSVMDFLKKLSPKNTVMPAKTITVQYLHLHTTADPESQAKLYSISFARCCHE